MQKKKVSKQYRGIKTLHAGRLPQPYPTVRMAVKCYIVTKQTCGSSMNAAYRVIRSSFTVHALNYVLLQKPPPLKDAQPSVYFAFCSSLRLCLLLFISQNVLTLLLFISQNHRYLQAITKDIQPIIIHTHTHIHRSL